jgi:hypothetical protein
MCLLLNLFVDFNLIFNCGLFINMHTYFLIYLRSFRLIFNRGVLINIYLFHKLFVEF